MFYNYIEVELGELVVVLLWLVEGSFGVELCFSLLKQPSNKRPIAAVALYVLFLFFTKKK